MYPYKLDTAYGEGRYKINIYAVVCADGLSITVMGGERPHVGGTVLSVPRRSLEGDRISCDTWVIPVPGHKDIGAALPVAEFITKETGTVTSVTAGIHIDSASRQEIDVLVNNSMEAARMMVKMIKETTGKNIG